MRNLKIFLFFLITTACNPTFGQRWELGLNAGGASYMGDLNQYNLVKISGVAAGAFAKLNLSPRIALGLHYTFGQIAAADSQSDNSQFITRNLSFYTPLHEISLITEFNFFDMFRVNAKKYSPYVFIGIGDLFFDPRADYNGNTYSLSALKTEGQGESYATSTIVIPYGAGVKYRMSEQFNLFSQVGFRVPLTDYLDDVSGNYPDKSLWGNTNGALTRSALSDRSGEQNGIYLGVPGTQRGDYRKRDSYMFASIGISYTFASRKCFKF